MQISIQKLHCYTCFVCKWKCFFSSLSSVIIPKMTGIFPLRICSCWDRLILQPEALYKVIWRSKRAERQCDVLLVTFAHLPCLSMESWPEMSSSKNSSPNPQQLLSDRLRCLPQWLTEVPTKHGVTYWLLLTSVIFTQQQYREIRGKQIIAIIRSISILGIY